MIRKKRLLAVWCMCRVKFQRLAGYSSHKTPLSRERSRGAYLKGYNFKPIIIKYNANEHKHTITNENKQYHSHHNHNHNPPNPNQQGRWTGAQKHFQAVWSYMHITNYWEASMRRLGDWYSNECVAVKYKANGMHFPLRSVQYHQPCSQLLLFAIMYKTPVVAAASKPWRFVCVCVF